MGGIDLNDQMRSYYQSGYTGKKWWQYIFWYFLDVAICNASVVEWLSPHATGTRNRCTLLHFKLDLAKQLIGEFYGSKRYPGQKCKFSPVDNTVALEKLWPSSCLIHRSQEILCPLSKARSSKSIWSYSRDHLAAIAVEWTFAMLGVSYSTIQKTASCNHPLCHTCPQIFATHFQFLSPSFPPPPHCFMNLVEATMPSRTISIDNTHVLCTFHIHYASVFSPPVLAHSQFVQWRMKERELATVLTAARSQCFFHVDLRTSVL